jgi:sugar O-acyltransferase (sialic acid O-acetyltransferase NeuD family)
MTSTNRLIIVGAGGFGREVAWLARSAPQKWDLLGFLDDRDELQGSAVCDAPVLGKIAHWNRYHDSQFVVAVGAPRTRKAIVEEMNRSGNVQFATLLHPSVLCSDYVSIAEGSIVCAGCILTTQVSIGRHCIINLGVSIGHDVSLGDYCTLAPRVAVSGNVSIERGVEFGSGAVVVPGITVAQGSMICAGATVTKPVAANVVAAGSPARRAKDIEPFS